MGLENIDADSIAESVHKTIVNSNAEGNSDTQKIQNLVGGKYNGGNSKIYEWERRMNDDEYGKAVQLMEEIVSSLENWQSSIGKKATNEEGGYAQLHTLLYQESGNHGTKRVARVGEEIGLTRNPSLIEVCREIVEETKAEMDRRPDF